MANQTDDLKGGPTRRHVMQGVGAVGLAAAATGSLAACGEEDGGGSTPSAPAASSDSPSQAAGSSTSGAAAAGIAVAASKVAVGGGFIDEANKIVVTQPTAGSYKAFSAICTHEGCPVDKVEDGKIECPCHGSAFDASTGKVVQGPAKDPLAAKTATLNGDTINVT